MTRRWRTLALVAVVLVGGCQSSPRGGRPLPAGPQVVDVEMADFSFGHDAEIAGGRTLFRVVNTGKVRHNLSLLPLTEDMPPIAEQLVGTTRRAITPLAAVRSRPPGARTTFAADLTPGTRYAFICFVIGDDGQPHWQAGMASEFRASGAAVAPAPEP